MLLPLDVHLMQDQGTSNNYAMVKQQDIQFE